MNKLSYIVEGSHLLTYNGYFYIDDLLGKQTIWDGYMWKDVIITKNDINFHSNIYYKLELSNGINLICYNEQNLNIVDDPQSNLFYTRPLYDVKENALIYNFEMPEIDGDIKYNIYYPYILGYYMGFIYNVNKDINKDINKQNIKDVVNNMYETNNPELANIQSDDLFKILEIYERLCIEDNVVKSTYYPLDDLSKNISVPINATKINKLLWLSGIIELTGSTTKFKDAIYLNISLNSKDVLIKIQYLCNTLGMMPVIKECKETRRYYSNNINKNENINIYHKLVFNAKDINKLFLHYDIKTYIFQYDKSIYSLDQDVIKYVSIKKINKFTKRLTTYKIKNSYSCIINGAIV